MDRISTLSASGMASATELTVASLSNPTELNAIGLAVPDWRVCKTVSAGTDDATWYRLDASNAAVNAPYVMASITAGLRWIAIAGRYANQILTSAATIAAKPNTTAGIAIDPNAATGDFLLSLSPANLTAARRWSFPDRSDTVAGLGAQTFTGAQSISATLSVGGISPSTASVISLDSGATPSKAQFSCRANNAGSLTGLVYDKDNISLLFDIDYSAGFIARATTGFNLNKTAGALILQSCTGQTIGSVVSAFTPIITLNTTGDMALNSATPSTSTTTGALVVPGGIGCGGRVTVDGVSTKTLKYVNGVANAAVAVLFGAIGPTGSTAGNAQGWIRIDVAGTDRYIPYW